MKINSSSNKLAKIFYLGMGLIFLAISIAGFLIPVFPGFLFLIPALYFFSKASGRLNRLFKRNKYYRKIFKEDAAE